MIVIVDYGVGNLRSIDNMLRKVGAPSKVSGDPGEIRSADKLILPGVGNFGYGMERLRATGLVDSLDWFALEARRPVLGICLGAQILGKGSEEAEGIPGLGWIDMYCHQFPASMNLPVPHMAWNTIELTHDTPLIPAVEDDTRYYFVHSYYMKCARSENVLARTEYGIRYTSAVCHENIFGTQFHPEKSHRFGISMMTGFAAL